MDLQSLHSTSAILHPAIAAGHCGTLSGAATLFACTWTAIHPNIPGVDEGKVIIIISRCLFIMVPPELIITWAVRQFFLAPVKSRNISMIHLMSKTQVYCLLFPEPQVASSEVSYMFRPFGHWRLAFNRRLHSVDSDAWVLCLDGWILTLRR
jgi:hypothetical protein